MSNQEAVQLVKAVVNIEDLHQLHVRRNFVWFLDTVELLQIYYVVNFNWLFMLLTNSY